MKFFILLLVTLFSFQNAFAVRGGTLTDSNAPYPFWKHTVKVIFPGDLICTGVIVDKKHFYTAAHCFVGERRFQVELQDMSAADEIKKTTFSLNIDAVKSPLFNYGPSDFLREYGFNLENVAPNSPDNFEFTDQLFAPENAVEIRPGNSEDDLFEVNYSTGELAIVTLPDEMEFQAPFSSVDVFSYDEFLSKNSFQDFTNLDMYISGFGDTQYKQLKSIESTKTRTQNLENKSARLPLRHSKQTLEGYGFFNPEIGSSEINNLGIMFTGGADTVGSGCFGDSGGPLFAVYEDKLQLIGLQIFELTRCKYSGFIPLPTYDKWVDENTTSEQED